MYNKYISLSHIRKFFNRIKVYALLRVCEMDAEKRLQILKLIYLLPFLSTTWRLKLSNRDICLKTKVLHLQNNNQTNNGKFLELDLGRYS